ncbi:hypothetical protein DE146DRAFT_2565 [Phaeosphaeria sp. MPI-PUGE-AT-0046c]|nr:hypothetical protein DE146DRAFT_2565 [Phaeosphaeria sp. MPI-PUGE-AT-0046c]
MEGRQLTTATKPNDNQAPMLLGMSGSFLIIAISLLCARIWSRWRNLKVDDWTVTGGTLLAIVNYTVQCIACSHGLGRRTRFVSLADRSSALRLIFILQVIFYWSITLVKISVALLLLRLRPTRRWSLFLYTTMAILLLTVLAQTLLQFLQCKPFSIFWDPGAAKRAGGVKCLPLRVINITIITHNAIHVSTDLILSVIPITFIRKLNRPRREKIFLSLLMGMGLFASLFSILRTVTLRSFGSDDDFFRSQVMPTLWGTLELEVALIAATVPTLRSFVQSVLVRLGAFFYDEQSETMVRGRLVELGFLVEGEVGERSCKGEIGREWEKGEGRKRRDEFGDTIEEKGNDFGNAVMVEEREIVMVAGSGEKDGDKRDNKAV